MTASPRILLVTGLSGAGKSSILRILEDLGLEAVDNLPLSMLDGLIAQGGGGDLAVGIDVRTSGFDIGAVLAILSDLRSRPSPRPELIYATADDAVLQRRYTATRRRHPMAVGGTVAEAIAVERVLLAPLREAADLVIDSSDLPPAELRRLVEARFSADAGDAAAGLTLSLISFAFPAGLPREADMVLDARFLRNPFYDPTLSSGTGLDDAVSGYIAADPDYGSFLDRSCALLRLVLPRFVAEGKKYATVAIGCTGGHHRSVAVVEALSRLLAARIDVPPSQQDGASRRGDWSIIVTHRELAREGRLRASLPHPMTQGPIA